MDQDKLRQMEENCIQEHVPFCTSACPVHVDMRSITAEMSRGDFVAALKILRKAIPFPGIIARICTQPCQATCKRREVGEAIEIAALERACVTFGLNPSEKITIQPHRQKRVAVIGSGLSSLTVAYDLAKKGYAVILFEAGEQLGSSLWTIPSNILPPAIIEGETSILAQMGVELRYQTKVSDHRALAYIRDEFDAVYLGIGNNSSETYGLETDEHGKIKIEAISYATSIEGVFAGGRIISHASSYSPIQSVSDGRRAATSIDRYAQNVSVTASRGQEGAYETRLFTNIKGIDPLPAVNISDPTNGYNQSEAAQEATRCIQCQCLECVKVCEYLKQFGSYPRKYTREIYNNLSIVKGSRNANRLINSCSLCGLCYEVCPTGFNMAPLCLDARQELVKGGHMPPSAHDFALRDMAYSNSEKCTLTRNAPGSSSSDYLFFPGCQLNASYPEHVQKCYSYLLNKLPGNVGLMLRCCGAPADWAGQNEQFQKAWEQFLDAYHALGKPQLILACSSCYQIMKRNLPDARMTLLWDIFDEYGLPEDVPVQDHLTFSVHDPCTTRHEQHTQNSVRNLIKLMGHQIEELPLSGEKTECCSYGGLMWFANRELAQDVIQRRISESPLDYVTYCAVCRDFFAAQGKRIIHLFDLIWKVGDDDAAERKSPGYSQRHENRARLKNRLLKDIWRETVPDSDKESIKLIISPDVQERIEKRLILEEDIIQVIKHTEETGNKIINTQSGHFLACHNPAAVTYWIEFSTQDGAYVIHNAYSHRMEIKGIVK